MGSVTRIFKKPSAPTPESHPIQKVAAAVDKPAINAMANMQKADPSFMKKVGSTKESDPVAKDTLGSSKKKKRLRDGRRSLISGSAMGVSDKLG
ncbi:MAG: hypothetical protein ABGX60_00055 [Candidatus Thioglobus sp.]|jgi:hypothetical protein